MPRRAYERWVVLTLVVLATLSPILIFNVPPVSALTPPSVTSYGNCYNFPASSCYTGSVVATAGEIMVVSVIQGLGTACPSAVVLNFTGVASWSEAASVCGTGGGLTDAYSALYVGFVGTTYTGDVGIGYTGAGTEYIVGSVEVISGGGYGNLPVTPVSHAAVFLSAATSGAFSYAMPNQTIAAGQIAVMGAIFHADSSSPFACSVYQAHGLNVTGTDYAHAYMGSATRVGCFDGATEQSTGASGAAMAGAVFGQASSGGVSCPPGYTLVNGVCQTGGGPVGKTPGGIVLSPGVPDYYRYLLGGQNALVTNFSAYFKFVNASVPVATIYLFIATTNGFFGLPSPTNPATVVWGRAFTVANDSLNFKLSVVPNVFVTAGGQVLFGVATVVSGVVMDNSTFPTVYKDLVDPTPPIVLTSAVISSGGPYMWIMVSLSAQTTTSTGTSSSSTGGCAPLFCPPAGLSCPGAGGSVAAYVAGFLFGSCVAAGWGLTLTIVIALFALIAVVVTRSGVRGVPPIIFLFPVLSGFFIGTAFGWLDPIIGILILVGLGSLGALSVKAKI